MRAKAMKEGQPARPQAAAPYVCESGCCVFPWKEAADPEGAVWAPRVKQCSLSRLPGVRVWLCCVQRGV